MKTAVVTGAAGFIGQKLIKALAERGCVTRGLDLAPRCPGCAEYLQADLTADGEWPRFLAGADTVFHLAGKVHSLAEVKADEAEYFRINTTGTMKVLGAAQRAGVKRFVFFSTVKAMSRDPEPSVLKAPAGHWSRALTEKDEIQPDTPYGRSKLDAERLVLNCGSVPEVVVLRLCMVYGPQAKGNVEKMIEAVRRRRFPPIPEFGNRRSMVHVQDVVRAALLVATHPHAPGEAFIVSDGQVYSTRQIYESICRALNRNVPRWSIPIGALRGLAKVGDWIGRTRGRRFVFDSDAFLKLTGSAWFSSDKIQSQLGFKPEWTFETALPRMMRNLAENPNLPS